MKHESAFTPCSLRERGEKRSQNSVLEEAMVSTFGREYWPNNGQGTQTDDQSPEFLTPQHCHLRLNWHQSDWEWPLLRIIHTTGPEGKTGVGSSRENERRSWQAGRVQRKPAIDGDERRLQKC